MIRESEYQNVYAVQWRFVVMIMNIQLTYLNNKSHLNKLFPKVNEYSEVYGHHEMDHYIHTKLPSEVVKQRGMSR